MANRNSLDGFDVFRVAKEAQAIVIANSAKWSGLPGEINSQLNRAMVSVVLNIAEGAGRWSPADQRRHYSIANGSANEVIACLDILDMHGVVDADVFAALATRLGRVGQMLNALNRRFTS